MNMDANLFSDLIESPESRLLDFKREHYKLIGSQNDQSYKLLKDIISFCNTIRDESAYIIIGVGENEGSIDLVGINDPIDDNILQSKMKDKAYPRPDFLYYNYEFMGKIFGVIEIPVKQYEEPIMPTVKMKGLEIGKVYHRQGSTNVEANGREVIQIHNWITSVRSISTIGDTTDKITELISRLGIKTEPLSAVLATGIKLGEQLGDKNLAVFCKNEIDGYRGVDSNTVNLNHRKVRIFLSRARIKNVQSFNGMGINGFWEELKNDSDFQETEVVLNDTLHDIEDTLQRQKSLGENSYITITRAAKGLFGGNIKKDYPVYIYTGYDSYNNIYLNIRKKITRMLLDLL
jgi:hypothetical protein